MTTPPDPLRILHADMDAFYAAIEQRDRPELRGKPVIVGSAERRGVVATASYEARRFGVRSAMPGVVARRLCPQGIFVAPRLAHYGAVSRAVMAILHRYTPLVEPLSLDEAFLDVAGSQALFGAAPAIARRIQDDVVRELGLTVSIGVATSKFVAKVASDLRKPRGLVVVPPGGERAFLAGLPLRCLWGAGKVMVARLEAHGLRTIGDVQALAPAALRALVGEAMGEHFHRLAMGDDPRAVEPEHEAKSVSAETTFAHDLSARADHDGVLLALSEEVGRRLRAEGLRGATVRIKVRHPDFTTFTRQRRLGEATHDDLTILHTATALLHRAVPDGQPLRLLGVGVTELVRSAGPRQQSLFSPAEARSERALAAMDRIRARFGPGAIRHGGTGDVRGAHEE
ncbi:MAG: DNA polymerase IV [Planctomycetes bacterium]|nr:DNA polymerase IV [Planctomycetota bacterium]